MKIVIFGMGHVGVVTAACLAEAGHDVVGVDNSATKSTCINEGRSPIVEPQLGDLLRRSVESKQLRAEVDGSRDLLDANIAMVCVGTPSNPEGELDLTAVLTVCTEIGTAIRNRSTPILIIFRSTMLPGSMRNVVLPALKRACGDPAERYFRAAYHPEFLREGSSVNDFHFPPKIVVGADERSDALAVLALYPTRFTAPRIACSYEVAEMVKYADNLFHAVKITFANEMGRFCDSHGVNGREVMEILCRDTKLNLSPAYLMPGFAFGGSCLPKDLRAVLTKADRLGLPLPMLQGVLPSNRYVVQVALNAVLTAAPRRVGLYGLAFKSGTDDLRESPFVELAEHLLHAGLNVICHDERVSPSRIWGGTEAFANSQIPDLSRIVVESVSALHSCDLVVICHRAPDPLVQEWKRRRIHLLDLSGPC